MKYLYLFLVVSLLALSACTRKEPPVVILPATDSTATDSTGTDSTNVGYIVSGLTDINIDPYRDSAKLTLNIEHKGGVQEKISFAVDGLPDGITAYFTPTASGIPTFSTFLTFYSSYAAAGKYPITVTGTSASGKVKKYAVDLVVTGSLPPCSEIIDQTVPFFKTTVAGGANVLTSKTLLLFGQYLQYMYLENINGFDVLSSSPMGKTEEEVSIYFDCNNNTIDIPAQIITASTQAGLLNYTVKGSGTIDFKAKLVTINYTVVNNNSQVFNYTIKGAMYL